MALRRAGLHYTALFLLLAATILFQSQSLRYVIENALHPERAVRAPFYFSDRNRLRLTITEADKAGLHPDDVVLSINGQPFTGFAVLGDALAAARPGDTLVVEARSPSGSVHTANVVLAAVVRKAFDYNYILQLLLFGVVPVFCIALGFWVVAVRPRDALAWLLLALLLSFTQIFGNNTLLWHGWLRYFGVVYNDALGSSWAIWMLLLGFYFPEPFPPGTWRKTAMVLQWVALPVLTASGIVSCIRDAEQLTYFAPSLRFEDALGDISAPFTYAALVLCVLGLAIKSKLATSRDAKRRLMLLYAGSFVSMAPAILITVIAVFRRVPPDAVVPGWLLFASLLLTLMFPLTFAYVIVVHRALDVRVVLRQSLQYALAKNGVRALQIAASSIVIIAALTLAADANRNRPQKLQAIALGVAAVFLLRAGAGRLRAWVDHRFFRDAYNAEQILTELSQKVLTMVEVRAVVETVSRRIAESLHVPRVAVLLDSAGGFRPAYALGFEPSPDISFLPDEPVVRQINAEKQPARVYFDDPDSWVNRQQQITQQDREKLQQLKTELLLPLSARDRLLGFISLGQKLSEEPYSGSDLRLLQSVAAQTGLALDNARLADAVAREIAEREKLNREVEIAREVQERLFPQRLTPIPGLDYCGKCRPALGVGGDYYDFLALPEGKLGIAIGDVSGKGISAALMMASLQASLRGQALMAPADLAKVVGNVNRLVYEASSANRYATFFYAQYDSGTRQLIYVNGGHNPPLVLRTCKEHAQNGAKAAEGQQCGCTLLRLEAGGLVIGLMPEASYGQGTVVLEPGDLFVAFTDGISEAMNPTDEEWGETRMIQVLQSMNGMPAAAIIDKVIAAADAFSSGAPQHDDMTLVVARLI